MYSSLLDHDDATRRRVSRAIRTGAPPADPADRALAETESRRQLIMAPAWLTLLVAGVVGVVVISVLTRHDHVAAIATLVPIPLLFLATALHYRSWRNARRYLGTDAPNTPSGGSTWRRQGQ